MGPPGSGQHLAVRRLPGHCDSNAEGCRIAGKVFFVRGGEVHLFQPWVDAVTKDGMWTLDELAAEADRFADVEFDLGRPWRST
jgi:hypothetical protein